MMMMEGRLWRIRVKGFEIEGETMSANLLRMPTNREPQPALNLPPPRIWTIDDLAKFLRVSRSWVEKRTRQIPHSDTKPITFDTEWDEFLEWLRKVIRPEKVTELTGNEPNE